MIFFKTLELYRHFLWFKYVMFCGRWCLWYFSLEWLVFDRHARVSLKDRFMQRPFRKTVQLDLHGS
jgi:hypothetical protein